MSRATSTYDEANWMVDQSRCSWTRADQTMVAADCIDLVKVEALIRYQLCVYMGTQCHTPQL